MKHVFLLVLLLTASVTAQIRTDFDRKMAEPFEPFKIIGNIFYVGAADAASYLITTDEGHILLDAAFEENAPQIEANIKTLGFNITDVKILLNNHAHTDHAGGLAAIKKKSGARLFATEKQAVQLEHGGVNDFAFGDEMTFTPVKSDKRIRDKDQITLGGTTLVAHFTPGHTKGCTTFTTTTTQGDKELKVVFLCSLSALNYDLVSNKDYPDIAKDFRSTFSFLRSLQVDVFLGSHASFFKMKSKVETLKTNPERNPFVDPEGYKNFVARNEKAFLEKLAKQESASKQDKK